MEAEVRGGVRAERVALAGGKMLDAAFSFLGELLPDSAGPRAASASDSGVQQSLNECLSRDEKGRPTLTVTLPDEAALQRLASSLSRLLATNTPASESAPSKGGKPGGRPRRVHA